MQTSDPAVVVADASPFIHLHGAGHLDLLRAVFGRVTVPATVAAEVAAGGVCVRGLDLPSLSWVAVVPDRRDPDVSALPALHPGEVAAISLARSLHPPLLQPAAQHRVCCGPSQRRRVLKQR